jgi:hypothetical protein
MIFSFGAPKPVRYQDESDPPEDEAPELESQPEYESPPPKSADEALPASKPKLEPSFPKVFSLG